MALQGRYYRMWQAQAQYYQEDQKMHDYLRERQQAKKKRLRIFFGPLFCVIEQKIHHPVKKL